MNIRSERHESRKIVILLLGLGLVITAGTAFASPRPKAVFIYDWNEVLSVALREMNTFHAAEELRHITGDNPPRSSRAMAIVHLAIFEAVNGITGSYSSFTPLRRQSAAPASVEAAIREAARLTLEGLFGAEGSELAKRKGDRFADRDDILRHAYIDELIASTWQAQQEHLDQSFSQAEIAAGARWGAEVARYILNERRKDGAHIRQSYSYTLDDNGAPVEGSYVTDKYTPDADNPPTEPGWGRVTPFAVSNIDAFTSRLEGPPALDWSSGSPWMAYLDEVRVLGNRRRYNPLRYEHGELPAEVRYQLRTAFFWSQKGLGEDGSKSSAFPTVTPAGQWGHAATMLAQEHDLEIDEAARLFALLSIAGADATIAAWKVKYEHNFWRPVHAIRRGEAGVDLNWIPLIPTSEHPEYVSGHSVTSGASATILALFFGSDSMRVTFFGDDALHGDNWRTFDSFQAAAEEAAMSRIYGGIHYGFSNRDGLLLGTWIAESIFADHDW